MNNGLDGGMSLNKPIKYIFEYNLKDEKKTWHMQSVK